MERRISCNEREWEDGTNVLCSREQDQVNNVGAVILYVASIFGYQGEQGLGWSRVYVMRRNNLRGAAGGSWSDHEAPMGRDWISVAVLLQKRRTCGPSRRWQS